MSIKKIILPGEYINITDHEYHKYGKPKNRIQIVDSFTQKPIFKDLTNKVVIAGSAYNAVRICPSFQPSILTPSYNTSLSLDNTVSESWTGKGGRDGEFVYLMCVGNNGCGADSSQKKEVNYASRIDPSNLVPFQYVAKANDLNAIQRESYFGRKAGDSRIAYYFKTWEGTPIFKQQFLDGTAIDENIYTSERALIDEVESFIQYTFKITTADCREYYEQISSLADAKISQISLCSAWTKTIDGYTYYQDIRPYTLLNFPTELLIDTDKAFDIIYQVFP